MSNQDAFCIERRVCGREVWPNNQMRFQRGVSYFRVKCDDAVSTLVSAIIVKDAERAAIPIFITAVLFKIVARHDGVAACAYAHEILCVIHAVKPSVKEDC